MQFLQEYIENQSVYKLALLKERYHIDNDLVLKFAKHKKLDLKLGIGNMYTNK